MKNPRPYCKLGAEIAIIASASVFVVSAANADAPYMRKVVAAQTATFTLYPVSPGMEQQFLDSMVLTSPYIIKPNGLANEKILTPLPNSSANYHISIARFSVENDSTKTVAARKTPVRQYLSGEPIRVTGKLVEHLLSDWGWEQKRDHQTIVVDAKHADPIFQKKLSSLSFFKTGYTGQAGMVQFYANGTRIDTIVHNYEKRQGLAGASIYQLPSGGYAVYSEYFVSPAQAPDEKIQVVATGDASVLEGSQGGMIAVNYVSR
jgi:hypothetical protein